jgi:hypothetical protein
MPYRQSPDDSDHPSTPRGAFFARATTWACTSPVAGLVFPAMDFTIPTAGSVDRSRGAIQDIADRVGLGCERLQSRSPCETLRLKSQSPTLGDNYRLVTVVTLTPIEGGCVLASVRIRYTLPNMIVVSIFYTVPLCIIVYVLCTCLSGRSTIYPSIVGCVPCCMFILIVGWYFRSKAERMEGLLRRSLA